MIDVIDGFIGDFFNADALFDERSVGLFERLTQLVTIGDGLAVTAPPQLSAFNDFLRRPGIIFSDPEQIGDFIRDFGRAFFDERHNLSDARHSLFDIAKTLKDAVRQIDERIYDRAAELPGKLVFEQIGESLKMPFSLAEDRIDELGLLG